MKRFKFTKKAAAIGLAAGIAMGAAGIAAAYFTTTGTGTGHAAVGTSSPWHFTSATTAVTKAYPTAGQSYVTYKFKNTSTGKQGITTASKVTVTVASSSGNIKTATHSTNVIATCKATWFSPTLVTTSTWVGKSVAHGGTITIKVKVTMNNGTGGTGSNQDACKTKTPKLTISIAA